MQKVYILSAVRTPIGSFGGVFKDVSAIDLGATAIKGAIESGKIEIKKVNEVFMGNVCSANLGQAPARQAAIKAGIDHTVPCTTVNKVCASGAKSIMLGAQSIMLGFNDVVVVGGMENMSQIPYYLPHARWGKKFGGFETVDGLQKDGLQDAFDLSAMGVFADATAETYNISREDQDRYAIQSYNRSESAWSNGVFKDEVIGVEVPQRKGNPILIDEDEEYKNVRFDKIPQLKPAFSKNGTVTAANASTINDGASALVLIGESKLNELDLKPIAEILSFADAAHEPQWFTTAPAQAAPIALSRAGLSKDEIDFWEVNEAFSVVSMVFNKIMELPEEKVNVHGGAVALGHPLGASGARIMTTLINVLNKKEGKLGCVAICNGGGGASSIVVRKV